MQRHKPSLIFVFFTLLLDVLGFGLLIPVAPKLLAFVQGLPMEGAEHTTSVAVGSLMATYAAMQFIFSPILGSLSDHFGRRPVLLCALLGSALDYFFGAMAPNLWVLFITRAINGVSGATVPVCSAYIADVTPPEKRAAGYGVIGAAFGLGFVIGPLIGGLIGDATVHLPLIGHGDVRYPYVAAGLLTLGNFFYGLFIVPESLAPENRRAFSWAKATALGALKWMSHHRVVVMLAATLFLSNVAQFGLHATWVLSMQQRFNWTPWDTGLSLFTVGLSAAFVQGFLARKLIPMLGERLCLVAGLALGSLAFLGYGLATHGWMVYTIIAIASIGGVAGPSAQAISSKAVGPSEQGLLQGAMGSLTSIAQIIGPLIGTGMFFLSTPKVGKAAYPLAGAPFFSSAILCLLSLAPLMMVWRRLPKTVKQAPEEGYGPGKCVKCGYDLAGLGSGAACPECGDPLSSAA